MKRLLRAEPVQAIVAWLAAMYLRLVYATGRWTTLGSERGRAIFDGSEPFIGCFWHGRMLMLPSFWGARRPIAMLTSGHQDGRLIARVIRHFCVAAVHGSSSRGSTTALRGMAQQIAQGSAVAVTPDGPRGPRMRAAAGIAMVAKLTGAPILPVSYSTSRGITLNSWDRFLLALPFGRGVFMVGEPIHVPRNADAATVDAARRAVEEQLNQLTLEADRLCGRPPVEPAAAPERAAASPT
jgi:lysophospholipid acyltransferase (LPLAT)-like uncharacterized protein